MIRPGRRALASRSPLPVKFQHEPPAIYSTRESVASVIESLWVVSLTSCRTAGRVLSGRSASWIRFSTLIDHRLGHLRFLEIYRNRRTGPLIQPPRQPAAVRLVSCAG